MAQLFWMAVGLCLPAVALLLLMLAGGLVSKYPALSIGSVAAALLVVSALRFVSAKKNARRREQVRGQAREAIEASRPVLSEMTSEIARLVEAKYPHINVNTFRLSIGARSPALSLALEAAVMTRLEEHLVDWAGFRLPKELTSAAAAKFASEFIVSELLNRRQYLSSGDRSDWRPRDYSSGWAQIRETRFNSDHGRCFQCGVAMDLDTAHVHHVNPKGYGGADDLENLRTLCPACHALMHPSLGHFKDEGEWLVDDVRAVARAAIKRALRSGILSDGGEPLPYSLASVDYRLRELESGRVRSS